MLWAALVLAGQRRERSVAPRVIEGIAGWPWAVQLAALWCLLQLEDPRSVPVLVDWLERQDIIEGLRRPIARCLGEVGDARAVEPLLRASQDRGTLLAEEAERALLRLIERCFDLGLEGVPALLATLASDIPQVASEAQRALVRLGGVAAGPLASELAGRHERRREAALSVLIRIGAVAVPPLIALVRGRSVVAGACAARALGAIGDARAVGPLVAALGPGRPEVARAAAEALGRIGDAQAAGPLLAALDRSPPDVRLAAAEALCTLLPVVDPLDPSGLTILLEAAAADHPSVAGAAARALGQSKRPEALGLLVNLLGAADPWVAAEAARALGSFTHPRLVQPLLRALGRPEPAARDAAVDTLVTMARHFAGQGCSGLAALVDMLAAEDPRVVVQAARALGETRDPRALRPLLKTCLTREDTLPESAKALARLADGDTAKVLSDYLALGDRRVTRGATEALVAIGRPAVRPLAKALKWRYPEARLAAAQALRRIGDPASASAFQSALRDTDPRVRREAEEALAQFGKR